MVAIARNQGARRNTANAFTPEYLAPTLANAKDAKTYSDAKKLN